MMPALTDAAQLADRPLAHALVLGGTGFLGGPLVRRLVAAGVRTTCLVHRRPATGGASLHGSIDTIRWRSLEADPPDVIFHLARIAGAGPWIRARNRLASERLAAWVASTDRPPLVVYVGGTLAYGSRGDADVSEATPLSPTSFARAYHAAEVPWLRALRSGDTPVIVARPAWVLGAGSWFEAYHRRVMARERAVPVYGGGDNWMSLVHVDDCAGLLLHLARHALPLSVVNVFAGPPLRQADFAARLAARVGLPVRAVGLDALPDRNAREAFTFSARIATVHRALHAGYAPLPLDEALRRST